jgi:TolB-like protein/DNA-binding winged helix-turn-helix (wHTH) protein/Tfp pilus assembly protein PilF
MLANAPLATVLRFGVFELDPQTGELRRSGIRLKLQKQPLQILTILLQHPDKIVTREELRSQIWSADIFVDFDNSLNTSINKLRDALGDTSGSPRFIETVPRRGYRFIAPVTRVEPASSILLAPVTPKRPWRWAILMTGVATAAIVITLTLVHKRTPMNAASARIRSIAVLPLRNLSPDSEQEYFSDGMTDELITSLAKIPDLRVISHTSVERYKQTKQLLPGIARELGVDAIVEGTVLRSGDSIRITAQLIDARSDQHLWAESYNRPVRDVLVLQGEVARRIAEQVGINLNASGQKFATTEQAIDPAAHEAYLKGNFYWSTFTCSGFETALKYYQEAASRAPDFAPAYAGMADAYFNLGDWRCWPVGTLSKAEAAAQKAAELDPQLGDAHENLGSLAFYYEWDWAKAQQEYSKAIELAPSDAGIHSGYSIFLVATGKQEQALAEMRKALELDPVAEPTNMTAVYVYYLAHQFDKGIEQAKKTLELFPESKATLHWLGQCYEQKGMPGEAIAAYLRSRSGRPEMASALKTAYQQNGLKGYYKKDLELKKQDQKEIDPIINAMTSVRLGENDRAIESLREAYRQRCDGLQFLKTEPVYDPLRRDSRFQELVAQLHI